LSKCIQHKIVPLYGYQHPEIEEMFEEPCDLPLSFHRSWSMAPKHESDSKIPSLVEIAGAIGWADAVFKKQGQMNSALDQYGHLELIDVQALFRAPYIAGNFYEGLPENYDITTLNFVRSICGDNVICSDKVKYQDIIELAWDKLRPQWGQAKICNLALRIAQKSVDSKFNVIRQALYDMKPELKGKLKSSDILDATDLTKIFTMSDFDTHGDHVVSEVFDRGIILSEVLEETSILETNGRTYVRLNSANSYTMHSLHKLFIRSPMLNIDWACSYDPDKNKMSLFPMQERHGRNNLKSLHRDREIICKAAGYREVSDRIPITMSMKMFDEFMEELSDRIATIRVGDKRAEELGMLKLEFTNGFCDIIKVPRLSSTSYLNVTELKDALHKLGKARTGNKDELVDKLCLALAEAYEDKQGELREVFMNRKGIILDKSRIGHSDTHGMRVTDATKCCKIYDNKLINEYLVNVFFSMHMSSGAIFDPDYDGAMFTPIGLIESLTKTGGEEKFILPRINLLSEDKPEEEPVVEEQRVELFPG